MCSTPPSLPSGCILILAAIFLTLAGCSPGRPRYPDTAKVPVIDTYHGVKVPDDYRWLDNALDSNVTTWVSRQNALTAEILGKIPARAAIIRHLRELYSESAVTYHDVVLRRAYFALKSQPPRQQAFLVSFDSPMDLSRERVVVDPNELDRSGGIAIDFYVPSRDGELVAVSLSQGGSENGTLRVYETSTGKRLPDEIPNVNYATAAGSVVWNADGSGFYYTRYPGPGERADEDMHAYQQVYFHRLGTAYGNDVYVIGKEFPRIAEIALSSTVDGRYLLASVANGDGGEFAYYLMNPAGTWRLVADVQDGIVDCSMSDDGRLYLLSRRGAPMGRVLSMPLAVPVLAKAETEVTEGKASIEHILVTHNELYTLDALGNRNQIRAFDRTRRRFINMLPTPPLASLAGMTEGEHGTVLYGAETYFEPFVYYQYDPAANATIRTHLADFSRTRFEDCEAVEETARSKDGTEIPMIILRKKGAVADGSAPVILYGYGGFNISTMPDFQVRRKLWLDGGGMYVIAHLRGGSEFGATWHEAGKMTRKQNVFDDFIACAERLIQLKYTSSARLAIEGASNGGLLMGAALTQRPDLFRCVISRVGIYDMLRSERFPNGSFNVTEFGSVADSDQFKALFAYSPYHHVTDDTPYPAVLMLTGDNDARVDPGNSRKMIAHLQAATSANNPVLLRTDAASGHGMGSALDARIAEDVDIFSFLADQLGVTVR